MMQYLAARFLATYTLLSFVVAPRVAGRLRGADWTERQLHFTESLAASFPLVAPSFEAGRPWGLASL